MAKTWRASPVVLKAFDTFNELDGEALFHLAEHSEIREYRRGQTAVSEGESPEWVFYILYGAVMLTRRVNQKNHGGSQKPEVVIQIFGPGDAIGDASIYVDYLFKGSIKALTECQVLAIKRASLCDFALQNPSVLLSLYNRTSETFLRMIDGIDLSAGALVDRIQMLTSACLHAGVDLAKHLTKAEIARMLGVSRVAVSQVMNKHPNMLDTARPNILSVDQ